MFNNKNNKKGKDIDEKQLEDIKSDFITVASHQLRTPMSAVRWSLDTLLSGRTGQLSEKQAEVAREAYRNNSFMVKVVNDLLRVSRVEEKGLNLMPEHIDIVKIIQEIIKENKEFADAFNCTILFKKPAGLPKIYVDGLQIKPVIKALIDNAIRYSKNKTKNKIEITLSKFGKFVIIKVKDDGIGIPEDQQHLIFTKFFRGQNAIKIQTEGIGLDLYLAKKIIDNSGGKINFKSVENKGTIFNIYLPITEKQFLAVKQEEKKEPEDIIKKEREFVSITVHELKAPLGITKWSLEMLKSQKPGKLTSDQQELINQIYRGNERLLVLVRDLLNLSKLQEGRFEIETRPILFEEVVSDVVNGFLVEATQKKVVVNWKNPAKPLPKVKADPNRVAQIVTNLVSNAIKYTPEKGNIDISITNQTGDDLKRISRKLKTADLCFINNKKGYLVFAVKDSGIGISTKDQEKLFSKFFRSKKVLKGKTEGTGLGLYITKSIINLHKGDIWFESRFGKGSTFYFSLPIA